MKAFIIIISEMFKIQSSFIFKWKIDNKLGLFDESFYKYIISNMHI